MNLGARRRIPVPTWAPKLEQEQGEQFRPLATSQTPVRTTKRKLSPVLTTPTGRQRKLSTSSYGSPLLRGVWETMADLNINQEQVQAPDLIEGIGLLQPRQEGEQSQRRVNLQLEHVRTRSNTVSGINSPVIRARRRLRTLSTNALNNQPKITDIFRSQREAGDKDKL